MGYAKGMTRTQAFGSHSEHHGGHAKVGNAEGAPDCES